jgi:hypothetical protein
LFNGARKLDIVWAEFPYRDGKNSTDTLLSWHLSRKERCGIEKVWDDKYGKVGGDGAPEMSKVASVLGAPNTWIPPVAEECTP